MYCKTAQKMLKSAPRACAWAKYRSSSSSNGSGAEKALNEPRQNRSAGKGEEWGFGGRGSDAADDDTTFVTFRRHSTLSSNKSSNGNSNGSNTRKCTTENGGKKSKMVKKNKKQIRVASSKHPVPRVGGKTALGKMKEKENTQRKGGGKQRKKGQATQTCERFQHIVVLRWARGVVVVVAVTFVAAAAARCCCCCCYSQLQAHTTS